MKFILDTQIERNSHLAGRHQSATLVSMAMTSRLTIHFKSITWVWFPAAAVNIETRAAAEAV